jgi:hypothetical protein
MTDNDRDPVDLRPWRPDLDDAEPADPDDDPGGSR